MSGLAPTTRVVRSDTGAQVALAEVADAPAAVPVWTLDGRLRVVPGTIDALTRRRARVSELRLASGRTAAVADDHRLLTADGWVAADRLCAGARVAVPRSVPDPAAPVWWPDDEVVLLAHLLADVEAAGRRPLCYSTGEEANADAVEKSAAHFGVAAQRVVHGDWWRLYLPAPADLPKGDRHPVLAWLEGLGVVADAALARLPDEVFALERRQLALFIRHLWAAGGVARVGDGQQAVVSYRTTSRALADDLQAALVRFGVATRVGPGRPGDGGWQVLVQGPEAQHRFVDEVGVLAGRGQAAQSIARFLAATDGDAAAGEIAWEVVTGLRPLGEQPVCAASVAGPGRPALLAGGIAVASG